MKNTLLASAALVTALSPSFAQDAKPEQPPVAAPATAPVVEFAPWTMVYVKGEAPRFRTYIRVDARNVEDTGDIKIRLRSTSKNTVTEVSDMGIAKWNQLDEKSEVIINNQPVPAVETPKPVALTFGPNGLVIKRVNPTGDPFDPSEKSLALTSSFPAPTIPVKVGEQWKTTVPNPILKNRQVTFTSTLLAAEKVLGLDAIKVRLQLDFPTAYGDDPADTAHLDGTYWLDAKNHQLLRLSYTLTNGLLPFQAKNVVAKSYVSRIVVGQNDKDDPEGEKLFAPSAPVEKPKDDKG